MKRSSRASRSVLALACLAVGSSVLTTAAEAPVPTSTRARNVILLVPDGMGLADVTATRVFKHGPHGGLLNLERLAFAGYQRNASADSLVTDSAAAASAWACGEKFDNGALCLRRDGTYPPSLIELARERGRRTGLVATSTVTHATPAAFGSHVAWRDCETEVARQYVERSRVDVILGGGTAVFRTSRPDACGTSGDYIAAARAFGYRLAFDRAELEGAVAAGATRILGLFAPGAMAAERDRSPNSREPRLPEMARAALDALEPSPNGFFLLIEGSQIDWENHANDQAGQLAEMLAFDEAVGVVLGWLAENPRRRAETLVIVAPDHETGGFAIQGPYGGLPPAGEMVWGAWTSGGHTGTDVPIWSQGPLAWRLARAIDNTEVYRVVSDAMR